MNPAYSAVVLVGGRSTRMGRDKAQLVVDGKPLWQRQVEVLREAGAGEIFFSARPGQTWLPADAIVVRDAVPGAGPLAGIAAALERCTSTHLLVLAVDLPRLPAVWFAQLRAYCRPGVGGVGKHDGYFEPLAAIYPKEVLISAKAALAAGEHSLQRLITQAGGSFHVHAIRPEEASWFANWNASADVPYPQE